MMPPLPEPRALDDAALVAAGRETFRQESTALAAIADGLDQSFADAVRLLAGCDGQVLVTGLGKSGIVARKLAATLTSTGTPSDSDSPA